MTSNTITSKHHSLHPEEQPVTTSGVFTANNIHLQEWKSLYEYFHFLLSYNQKFITQISLGVLLQHHKYLILNACELANNHDSAYFLYSFPV